MHVGGEAYEQAIAIDIAIIWTSYITYHYIIASLVGNYFLTGEWLKVQVTWSDLTKQEIAKTRENEHQDKSKCEIHR